MKKDLILSLCVILGVGGVVFGAGFLVLAHVMDGRTPSPEQVAVTPDAGKPAATRGPASDSSKPKNDSAKPDKSSGGTREKAAADSKSPPEPVSPAILAEIEARYNDLLARNRFDECREVAIKAMTYPGHSHAAWQLRLALATSQSESLPKQQRHAKALELFSSALALGLEPVSKEQALHGICSSLAQLSRWEELAQAANAYMKEFKQTLHTPEVMLFHALGVAAEGKNADARAELNTLTGDDVPDAIRAQALWHIAQLNLKEAEAKGSESVLIADVKSEPHNVPPQELFAPALVVHAQTTSQPEEPRTSIPSKAQAENDATDIPEAQWESIRRALQRSEFSDAQRLLEPYLLSMGSEQRARISMKYANLMVKISANRNAGDPGK